MKMAGVRRGPLRGKLVVLLVVLLAVLLSVFAYERTVRYPASDDASLDADLARAMLGTRQRTIGTERGTASVASEQIARAEQNYALTARTVERLRPLAADGYMPKQQLDQAEVAKRDAAVTLKQAQLQRSTTAQAVGNDDDAIATVHAREAALAIAPAHWRTPWSAPRTRAG